VFKKYKRYGYTLYEAIVVGGIFILFMAVVSSIWLHGWRSLKKGDQRVNSIRQARLSMAVVVKELRSLERIYSPDESIITSLSGSGFIVFSRQNLDVKPSELQVIGFRKDSATGNLLFIQYDPAYDPAVTSTQKIIRSRIIGNNISSFNLYYDKFKRIFTVNLTVPYRENQNLTIHTKVIPRR